MESRRNRKLNDPSKKSVSKKRIRISKIRKEKWSSYFSRNFEAPLSSPPQEECMNLASNSGKKKFSSVRSRLFDYEPKQKKMVQERRTERHLVQVESDNFKEKLMRNELKMVNPKRKSRSKPKLKYSQVKSFGCSHNINILSLPVPAWKKRENKIRLKNMKKEKNEKKKKSNYSSPSKIKMEVKSKSSNRKFWNKLDKEKDSSGNCASKSTKILKKKEEKKMIEIGYDKNKPKSKKRKVEESKVLILVDDEKFKELEEEASLAVDKVDLKEMEKFGSYFEGEIGTDYIVKIYFEGDHFKIMQTQKESNEETERIVYFKHIIQIEKLEHGVDSGDHGYLLFEIVMNANEEKDETEVWRIFDEYDVFQSSTVATIQEHREIDDSSLGEGKDEEEMTF